MNTPRRLAFCICLTSLCFGLGACTPTYKQSKFNPPHDSFSNIDNVERNTVTGGAIGALFGVMGQPGVRALGIAGVGVGLGVSATPAGLTNRLRKSGIEVVRLGDNVRIVIPSDEVFYFNSTDFKNRYYPALNDVAHLLKFFPRTDIAIAAYNDAVDKSKAHQQLSTQRAEAVRSYLWAHGIDSHYTYAVGMGSKDPVANNIKSYGMRANRRIEITLRSPEWNSLV